MMTIMYYILFLLFIKVQCVRNTSFWRHPFVCGMHAGARSVEIELKASSIINVMAFRVGSNVPSLPVVY